MREKKFSYILGTILGISLMLTIFSLSFFIFPDKVNSHKKEEDQLALLKLENENLARENTELRESNTALPYSQQGERSELVLEITEDMSNSAIADLLVENKVYPHKGDITMLLELINIKNRDYVIALENNQVMRFGGDFLINMNSINENREFAASLLKEKGFVEDTDAFQKLVYLENYTGGIQFGSKSFYTGISLGELADILIGQ